MIKSIVRTPHFKRDYKALLKKHYDMRLFEAALRARQRERNAKGLDFTQSI